MSDDASVKVQHGRFGSRTVDNRKHRRMARALTKRRGRNYVERCDSWHIRIVKEMSGHPPVMDWALKNLK